MKPEIMARESGCDFQKMIDRGGPGKFTGERLLKLSNGVFRNWHRGRDGTATGLAS